MSSVGRIVLGVVGAAIGAPFGLSAIGFSIGSTLGGMAFAPDGPKTEGPRIGDTSVTASSLGKVIPEHWGVTRASGNVIWSAGLKEVKKKEKQGGGKGGGGATSTTYEYYGSFALCFGKGPAKQIRRIWADGKLIYSVAGDADTNSDKYKFRFYKGTADQDVDPMIRASINRRLAGLPDVNEGNQEQAEFTGITGLIEQCREAGTPRSNLYAQRLWDKKLQAELVYVENESAALPPADVDDAGAMADYAFDTWTSSDLFGGPSGPIATAINKAASGDVYGGPVPNYRFAPAYRGLCYIVFDNMPLVDFGNRLPNVTAEIVWAGATLSEGLGDGSTEDPDIVKIVDVTEMGVGLPVPNGMWGVDVAARKVLTQNGQDMRRFDLNSRSEDRQGVLDATEFPVSRILGVMKDGTAVATYSEGDSDLFIINARTLSPSVLADVELGGAPSFGAPIPIADTVSQEYDPDGGYHFAFLVGDRLTATRITSDGLVKADNYFNLNVDSTVPSSGPVVSGGQEEKGVASVYTIHYGPTAFLVSKGTVTNRHIKNGFISSGDNELSITPEYFYKLNPFAANISNIAGLIYDYASGDIVVVANLVDGRSGIARIDFEEGAKTNKIYHESSWDDFDEALTFIKTIPYTAPNMQSGFSRSDISNNWLGFMDGTTAVEVSLGSGQVTAYPNTAAVAVSRQAQLYIASIAAVLAWEGNDAKLYYIGRPSGSDADSGYADSLKDVIRGICLRCGMDASEFDVSSLNHYPVRGFSIARSSTGRQALESILQAFFVDGVESDWKVVFRERDVDPIREIHEDALGSVGGPTGDVNWLETRTPEFDIPAEVNLNFIDLNRDYQTGTAHKRRISNPIPSMYSDTSEEVELPLVMKDYEAQAIAERLLYLSWMSRDTGKGTLDWTHIDLDPGDVVNITFSDGRTITDRLAKTTLGADFSVEITSARSGDPVYTSSPQTVIPSTSVPARPIRRPAASEVFVFDIPLLYDYHDLNRNSSRYYSAVGAETQTWRSSTIFKSTDGDTFTSDVSVNVDITWGYVSGKLERSRSVWTLDPELSLRVDIVQDNGDLSSVTFEQLLGGANRALILNPGTGVGEIIQFQNAVADGRSVVLSGIIRGLRGTDYAVDKHRNNAQFFLLNDAAIQSHVHDLERVGGTEYFKSVSTGQIISAVDAKSVAFAGKDLMPWAPSRVNRTWVGDDLQITWNRRARVGGAWVMSAGETVPIAEDSERYEAYLLPNVEGALSAFRPTRPDTYSVMKSVTSPQATFTAAELASAGYLEDSAVLIGLYQISGQVGRGFPMLGSLAP